MNNKPRPSAAILRKVSRYTADNAHDYARLEIANWLKKYQPEVGAKFVAIFGAIKTAHEADGSLDYHLHLYRHDKTEQMLFAVSDLNPAAYVAFYECL